MLSVFFAVAWLLVEGMGIAVPSEGAFAMLSAAIHGHYISIEIAFLIAWVATCVGNIVGYQVFWHYGPKLLGYLEKRWPSLTVHRRKWEPRIQSSALPVLALVRFVGFGAFGVVLWLTATLRLHRARFLLLLGVLNLAWTFVWLFASHLVVQWLARVFNHTPRGQIIGLVVAGVALLVLSHQLIEWVKRSQRNRPNASRLP